MFTREIAVNTGEFVYDDYTTDFLDENVILGSTVGYAFDNFVKPTYWTERAFAGWKIYISETVTDEWVILGKNGTIGAASKDEDMTMVTLSGTGDGMGCDSGRDASGIK